jgi:DNA polymerase-4
MSFEDTARKIIHIDMDAFYASVEQLDNPELKGKAVAVGGGAERGVVAASSYEARKYGVKSAMSGAMAKRKCPHLIFVKPRFERYKEISNQIRAIFHEYTDLVEPLALDEAFLDVSNNIHNHNSATEIAQEIRDRIFEETSLTASAGISINKFTAKIASDINKPNGQKTIKPHEILKFLEHLPINKFFGIGKVTAEKMHSWGIFNGLQLKQQSLNFLNTNFGKSGQHYYNIVRGIQNSEVKPNRERKSVGAERTYSENITDKEQGLAALNKIAETVENRMKGSNCQGKTVTLKVKFSDFSQITRSKTIEETVDSKKDIFPIIEELYLAEDYKKTIRLLGISISNFGKKESIPINNIPSQLKFDF